MTKTIRIEVNTHEYSNRLEDCGYTPEEAGEIYDNQLQDIIDNPKLYLDNLDYLKTYRVPWKDYRDKTAVLPLKHVKKRNI